MPCAAIMIGRRRVVPSGNATIASGNPGTVRETIADGAVREGAAVGADSDVEGTADGTAGAVAAVDANAGAESFVRAGR